MAVKKGLGKGLDALFEDTSTGYENENSGSVLKLNEIEPNRNQPRRSFDETALSELAESIRAHGLIQPIIVRPMANGSYSIIAGERRWRASRMAGLTEVPVVIMDISDQKAMELAIIENLQREDLNPIEEAQGFKELMESYNMTQAEVSESVGKSRSAIANTVRLLTLPKKVMDMVSEGKLSAGHARALLAIQDSDKLEETAEAAIKQGLNVRDIERLAKTIDSKKSAAQSAKKKDSFFEEIKLAMETDLGYKVNVKANGEKGCIEIPFNSKEELSNIAAKLAK